MEAPLRPRVPRRQAWLFLVAIVVPCLVVVGLGLRLMQQERQLQDGRVIDDRQRLVTQVRQDLLARLEETKVRQMATAVARGGRPGALREQQPAIALVGGLVDTRLQLPWDDNPQAQRFRAWLDEPRVAGTIRQAEAAEFIASRYETAAQRYQELIATARQRAPQAYARLLLARALEKWGRHIESRAEYGRVLASSPDMVDEHGVPLAFYAMPPLLEAGARQPEMLERLRLAVDGDQWLPPAALYLARDLARKLPNPDLETQLAALIQDSEQAEALQRDFARLMPALQNREPVWIRYGEPAWLVSAMPLPGSISGLVVAVRANDVVARLSSTARPIRIAASDETSGDALGENFPGLRLVLPARERQASSAGQALLALVLILALAFTLVAGYLLWRDVQREWRLAELRSQFVSSVTHELRTPLTAIRMFTETLRLDEDVDLQTRREYLDTILHESERLSRLVDNVLDSGAIERGKKIYRLTPVRLEDVVNEAARAIQYPLEQAGFRLELAVERGLPLLHADADAMQQAILNLLTNAVKYSGESRHIRLGLDRKNGDARIQVVDRGVGIAREEQGRILERFYRVPTSENRHIPGTGLGLPLVVHIAKAHGGDLEIESTKGVGSTFTIRLPLPEGDPAQPPRSLA